MKYQEIIIKLGGSYYRASAVNVVGVSQTRGLLIGVNGIDVAAGIEGWDADDAKSILATLMTLRIPAALQPPAPGVVVESFDPPSQTYEALVDLDAYFASKEAP